VINPHTLDRIARTLGLAACLAPLAGAQNDITWATFAQDNGRVSGSSTLSVGDLQEKDYDWGDLDHDGDDDLVCVRKQPFTSSGRFINVLFMNEGGVLTIRTSQYAAASDVPGDDGFLTATNDRDVALVDVDMDGWLDVVTATTLSAGQPKHISHPRVYMNLGDDGAGNWLGLMHEDARIPQLYAGATATFPRFCAVGAGDVTGDGFPDLFFADYDSGGSGGGDLNDRLLINDGNGFFTDESSSRMNSAMLNSGFGTSAVIVDLNGDGVADILDGESGKVAIYYNNPANEGNFNILHNPYGGAPYHVSAGDLNQDGLPDLLISDDGQDRYLLNQGNDGIGRVIWSSAHVYNTDDGFASDNLVADLNNDGWPEALYADVDVDIGGCNRRAHIFHNRGGTVGGFVDMVEESGGGFKAVTGLPQAAMTGMHDIAAMDLEGDGDLDLVFGRCSGMDVWINQLDPIDPGVGANYCGPAVVNSTGLSASMSATGSDVAADNSLLLMASNLPTNQFGYFVTSASQGFIANPGGSQGNLCLSGTLGRFVQQVQSSGPAGQFSIQVDLSSLPAPISAAVMGGETWNFTAWYRDVNPGTTSNFADGLSVLFQ
jgi:hypothetical protein